MMRNRALLWAGVVSVAARAFAEVGDVSPSGFLVRHEVTVSAAPAKVYQSLTSDVGSWWSPDHTYSGDARNLSIEARPGGCFCEKLPSGGGVVHMTVVWAAPGRVLRMTGALGPLQGSGLAGSLTWKLTAGEATTKVELLYSVGGYMQGGFEKLAPAVNGVLGEQLSRLKSFVETGRPTAKEKP